MSEASAGGIYKLAPHSLTSTGVNSTCAKKIPCNRRKDQQKRQYELKIG